MSKILGFSEGMASLPSPEMLSDNQSALIENMKLDESGTLVTITSPTLIHSTAFAGALKAWQWSPVYLPTGCIDTYVFICALTTSIVMKYRTATNTWASSTLISGIVGSKVRAGSDGTQFVFVDGRTGSRAQRIMIDEYHAVTCHDIGVRPSTTKPVIASLEINKDEDNTGIGAPIGSTLMYCYCIINKFGERSNPSPVAVMSHFNEYVRGEFLDGDYEYDPALRGSIKSVAVTCSIPYPAECARVELYRSECDYIENMTNPSEMTLCASIQSTGTDTVTILDVRPRSVQPADYENDLAPTGDDIALSSGVIFIANAVTNQQFPVNVNRAWKIVLTNNNEYAYINQWHRIMIYGKSRGRVIDPGDDGLGYNWDDITGDIGFYDTDRCTLLNAELRGAGTTETPGILSEWDADHEHMSEEIKYERLYHIQIPIIPAHSEKIIYLVEASSGVTIPQPGDYEPTMRLLNPVRRNGTALALHMADFDRYITGTSVNGLMPIGLNKANRNPSADEADRPSGGAITQYNHYAHDGVSEIAIDDLDGLKIADSGVTGEDTYWTFDLGDRYIVSGGFACIGLTASTDNNTEYATKVLRIGDSNTFLSLYYYKKANRASVVCKIKHPKNQYNLVHAMVESDTLGDNAFLYVSWGRPYYDEAGIRKTPILVGIFHQDTTGSLIGAHSNTWLMVSDSAYMDSISSPECLVSTSMDDCMVTITNYTAPSTPVITGNATASQGKRVDVVSHIYVEIGKHYDSPRHALDFLMMRSVYPTEGIGYCGDYANYPGLTPAGYYAKNLNVSISSISLDSNTAPGRIRWSRGAGVPELHEIHTYDEILRIYPMKSFMPTDEHNTLLVWTASGKLMRVNLIDDARSIANIITDMENVVLTSPDALVAMHGGLVWNDQNGLMYLTQSGTKDIIAGRLPRDDNRRLVANARDEEVYSVTSGALHTYSSRYDAWSKVTFSFTPIAFVIHTGLAHVIDSTGKLWRLSGTAKLTPKVITKAIPAGTRIRKIMILGDHKDTAIVLPKAYHPRENSAATSGTSYEIITNELTALPGLKANYVQFEITGIDAIKGIGIEDGN